MGFCLVQNYLKSIYWDKKCESCCSPFLKRESYGFRPSRRYNDSGVSHPVMQSITERSEKPEVFESHKPKDIDKKTKKGKLIEVWGLTPKKIKRLSFLFSWAPKNNSYELFFLVTLCENKNCSLVHNRDKNSALNMYKITQSILNGKGRPVKYCREIKEIHSC